MRGVSGEGGGGVRGVSWEGDNVISETATILQRVLREIIHINGLTPS